MAGSVAGRRGGILGLLGHLDQYGEAIEYDLLRSGWTLGDVPHRLDWRSLKAWVRQSAQQRGTALHRALMGDEDPWGLSEHLLALLVDVAQEGNWLFRSANSKSRVARPKPIPRPGVGTGRKIAGQSVPLSKARAVFRRHNPGAFVPT